MNKCEGEATASNRKGKLIFFYEWVVKLEWTAILEDDPKKDIKGTIEIPNLSEENDPEEVDVSRLHKFILFNPRSTGMLRLYSIYICKSLSVCKISSGKACSSHLPIDIQNFSHISCTG